MLKNSIKKGFQTSIIRHASSSAASARRVAARSCSRARHCVLLRLVKFHIDGAFYVPHYKNFKD